jgi:hypothetical protein
LFERPLILILNLFSLPSNEERGGTDPRLLWRNQASFSSLNRRAVAPLGDKPRAGLWLFKTAIRANDQTNPPRNDSA